MFAFIVKGWYNRGTKGGDAIVLAIACKKPGVAAPGFLFAWQNDQPLIAFVTKAYHSFAAPSSKNS